MISRREDAAPPTSPTIEAPSWLQPGAPRRAPGDAAGDEPAPSDGVAEGTAERAAHVRASASGDCRDAAPGGSPDAPTAGVPDGPIGADHSGRTPGPPAAPIAPVVPIRRIEQFILLERIGAGGMGEVFAAFDDKLERKVAIKLVATQGSDDRARSRLLREAQALARLSHPNVVTIYEVGALPDGGLFIAMELVKGLTLRAWQRDPARTWRDIAATYAEAGRGLAAAHQTGIVHRDFKPDNVLVGDDGRVRVADFGLAFAADGAATEPAPAPPAKPPRARPPHAEPAHGRRPAQRLTAAGRFAGTPGYMAPEQLAGAAIDARADQFSFCVALHEALHGERPEPAGADRSAAHGPRRDDHEPVHPRWLRDLVRRGLAHDPAERFATMNALLAELTRSRERTRRRVLVGALVAALATAGVASAALSGSDGPPPCPLATAELAGAWDAAVRQRSEAAIAGTAAPFARSVWASTAGAFDRYAQRWLVAQRAACEATRVRHVQSATLLERRIDCLAARRRSLAAAAEVLQRRPSQAVSHAGELVASLGDIEPCADTAVLLELSRPGGEPPVPSAATAATAATAAHTAQVLGVRQQLASASALLAIGDAAGAEPVVAEAERRAAGLDDGALGAELLYAQGRLRLARGETDAAIATLDRAVAQAVSSHSDELPVDAWLTLATAPGGPEQRPAEVGSWLGQAEAWLHRLGHAADSRRVEVAHARAGLLRRTGDVPGAVTALSGAIGAAEALWGKDDPRLVALLCDRAAARGEIDRAGAVADAERAVALGIAAWGPDYPGTVQSRSVLAGLRSQPGP